MRENYYWYNDMPDAKGLNFFTEPNVFFQSLLSPNDGKQRNGNRYYYSILENLSETSTRSIQQTDYSYGFEFRVYDMGRGNQYGALILYVVPDSPAWEAGLKRGEWIFEIDGKPLSDANYTTLAGGGATKLGIGIWHENDFVPIGEYTMEAARKINDNPIHYHTTIHYPNGKRIGYLVYNQFKAGINDGDNTYDDDLREVSHEFKDKDVNEFVLDLRYNNGGLLTSAELLCAILAPESALGQSLGYVEFNNKHNPPIQNISLNTNILKGGVNLNLSTLYVLISEASASASEMVINSLSPYMKVVLIGTQTEGKNVGSTTYKNEEFNWALHPIVCKIYNSENMSEYANGFIPDYTANESLNINNFLDFGNPDELLLNTALQLINGTYKEEEEEDIYSASRSLTRKPVPVHCSLDRKATNGVIIQ
ncbi:putative CtpA-like serine protease [termite gut metagenome]|uniref:Putative CtpA-like serine protease n=1 Tax=termite gut metagenome TaxID=433724 RepID=A0A5J4R4G8_9ZZZZ